MRLTSIFAIIGDCGSLSDFNKPGVCAVDIGEDPHVAAAQIAARGGTPATEGKTVAEKLAENMRDDMSGCDDFRDDMPIDNAIKPTGDPKSAPVHVRNDSGFSVGVHGRGDASLGPEVKKTDPKRVGWGW